MMLLDADDAALYILLAGLYVAAYELLTAFLAIL